MGGPSSVLTKKQPKRPIADVDVEEVAKTSAPTPPTVFHRDYLPPRRDDTPPVNVPVNAKYPLPITPVLNDVSSDEDMLGKVANLKFMDHDITDTHKFPELVKDQYLCTKIVPGT
jgi:hypothetical protein